MGRRDGQGHAHRVVADFEMLSTTDAQAVDSGKLAGACTASRNGEGISDGRYEIVDQGYIQLEWTPNLRQPVKT